MLIIPLRDEPLIIINLIPTMCVSFQALLVSISLGALVGSIYTDEVCQALNALIQSTMADKARTPCHASSKIINVD
ncbi:hypothetical protein GALMADRAFT_711026 [Galerina marginata CBS 339.88]|uniref:Uncharacterized protein n=1 Tax=Galerina marginata (strain CBS 339.88) TaxID=685588 RepID=A0A067TPY8_GALM3|nr:hypothetical protein GALMADRAFT_711026 [Galerina marginata CBS 339.88]